MATVRIGGQRGLGNELVNPGDTVLTTDIFSLNTTVGTTTIPAAQLVTGELYRSGSAGAYTDTLDSAANILLALYGNNPGAAVIPGLSFKLRITNSVAFVETVTLGAGMVAGSGPIGSLAASTWRDFLFTFTSVQPPFANVANTVNGSAVVTWYLLPGQISELEGPSVLAINLMPGASVSGTGIPAGATVIGLTQGLGGTLGFTMSANATATGTVSLSFSPTISVSSSGSGTL